MEIDMMNAIQERGKRTRTTKKKKWKKKEKRRD
jgi:hypothetical protein